MVHLIVGQFYMLLIDYLHKIDATGNASAIEQSLGLLPAVAYELAQWSFNLL